jgi:molybdopterin-guanine dinucleotide biosynthesis protein A/molybdopterin converting factor small subunit
VTHGSNNLIANGSAVILGGGKSSRMGRPKALLPFDGEPLILHIARKLQSLFSDLIIVAAPDQQFDLKSLLSSHPNDLDKPNRPKVTLVHDDIAYQGPVGGIYYGMREAAGEFCFVTSCDVPFLSTDLIGYLVALIDDNDIVAPYWQERFQPLCAVYRRSVLPLLAQQLERGELRPIYLYDKVRTRKVVEDEIRRVDPEGLSFFNMNSPADYEAAQQKWNERQRVETEPERSQKNETLNKHISSVSVPVSVTVELFGVPRLLAKTREISLSLPAAATLSDVLAALAARLPVLAGRVIDAQKSALSSGYACNVNGLQFVRNPAARINPGDKIFIVAADAGG